MIAGEMPVQNASSPRPETGTAVVALGVTLMPPPWSSVTGSAASRSAAKTRARVAALVAAIRAM